MGRKAKSKILVTKRKVKIEAEMERLKKMQAN